MKATDEIHPQPSLYCQGFGLTGGLDAEDR